MAELQGKLTILLTEQQSWYVGDYHDHPLLLLQPLQECCDVPQSKKYKQQKINPQKNPTETNNLERA